MTNYGSQTRVRQRRAPLAWIAMALAALLAGNAPAEIYRYRDANGAWQFTDRPPPGSVQTLDPSGGAQTSETPDRNPGRDLAAELTQRFKPANPVETASLAVVKIETAIGNGSGFFVTPDGLILTNRHVVRPPQDWSEQQEARLAKLKGTLDDIEARLAIPRSRYRDPQDYDRIAAWHRSASSDYRQAKLELGILQSQSVIQNSFQIQIKDGTKMAADLIELGVHQDLALLKLHGYRTPYIEPLRDRALAQSEPVYLIGSPLGVADTVSRGVFSGRFEGMLGTDSRILPGNSGGPMVSEDGKAAGVNTLKRTAGPNSVLDQGLGFAIPIESALAEFPRIERSLR